MSSADELVQILDRIDGRGYRAYKDLRGRYAFADLELLIDHVQGDPFAAASKLRVRIPMRVAALPETLWKDPVRRLALSVKTRMLGRYLTRNFHMFCRPDSKSEVARWTAKRMKHPGLAYFGRSQRQRPVRL